MSSVESVIARPRNVAPSLKMALRALRRNLRAAFLDDYRPELHYMRGPGPKWREKHAAGERTTAEPDLRALHQATA